PDESSAQTHRVESDINPPANRVPPVASWQWHFRCESLRRPSRLVMRGLKSRLSPAPDQQTVPASWLALHELEVGSSSLRLWCRAAILLPTSSCDLASCPAGEWLYRIKKRPEPFFLS